MFDVKYLSFDKQLTNDIIAAKSLQMTITRNHKYTANFTAGGLLHHEFITLQSIIQGERVLDDLKNEAKHNQFMGVKTYSGRKRILSEIKRRLEQVDSSFWEAFYNWTEPEQKLALLYLCLKTYQLILDFHLEVTIKKYKTIGTLHSYDISMRLDELASLDDHVASWSESTIKRINHQYRKALQDAGLLQEHKLQIPQSISNSFWEFFKANNEVWFFEACFVQQ